MTMRALTHRALPVWRPPSTAAGPSRSTSRVRGRLHQVCRDRADDTPCRFGVEGHRADVHPAGRVHRSVMVACRPHPDAGTAEEACGIPADLPEARDSSRRGGRRQAIPRCGSASRAMSGHASRGADARPRVRPVRPNPGRLRRACAGRSSSLVPRNPVGTYSCAPLHTEGCTRITATPIAPVRRAGRGAPHRSAEEELGLVDQ
jgi:hypothetical protein